MTIQRHTRQKRLQLAALAVLCFLSSRAWSAENVVVEWRFDSQDASRGWVANGHIRDVEVSGGALYGETTDWDPMLLGPTFAIPATPTQRVEIKLRTPHGGRGQLFWTQTLEGRYGGFSQQKACDFVTRSDDAFQVVRIDPFWHAAGKIVRLRLDLPATGKFAVAWVRIVDAGSLASTDSRAWRFASDAQGWQPWQDISRPVVKAGRLQVTANGKSPTLISPRLSITARENPFVSLRMATQRGSSGRVFCVSNTQFGRADISFPLRSDGQFHSYNINVGQLGHWRDQIILLGVQPTNVEGAEVSIESIEIGAAPRGPAEVEVGYFGPAEGINRTGRPAEVTLSSRNLGGDAVLNLAATLTTSDGVRTIGPTQQTIARLTHWLPKTVSWQVEASRSQRAQVAVKLEGRNMRPISATAAIAFTPAPRVSPTAYIPEPRPVRFAATHADYRLAVQHGRRLRRLEAQRLPESGRSWWLADW